MPYRTFATSWLGLAMSVSLLGCGNDSVNTAPFTAHGALTDAGANLPPTAKDAGKDAPAPLQHDAGTSPETDAGIDTGAPGQLLHKRGIAYGHHSDADLAALSAGVTWWYNWSPVPDSSLSNGAPNGVEFVPMVWGGNFDPGTLANQVPQGAKYLLTFNEPNFGSQSNLTPQQAAALWPKIEAFAQSRNMKIVSPALNYCGGNCNETNPFNWLDLFFAACTNCQVDYIGAHWYACTKDALSQYLTEYETKYQKPIWLTEFSCMDDSSKVTPTGELLYLQDAVALLEADPMVFRYSWFTGRFTQQSAIDLLAGSGALTSLGQKYVALPEGP